MVKVRIVNNVESTSVIVDENKTIKEILQDSNVVYSTAVTYIDGAPLSAGEINKTLADLGVTEECVISSITKNQNA